MISFDDAVTARNLPTSQEYAVFYIDGEYANEAEVKARLPHAKVYAGITVIGPGRTGSSVAFCDCEKEDLTPAQAETWVAKQVALKVGLIGVYANLSTWAGGLYEALAKYKDRIKRWCAAYDQDPALTLTYQGRSYSFDAHQWAGGVDSAVDKNVAADDFFTPYKEPKPVPKPVKPSGIAKFSGTWDLATGAFTIKGEPGVKVVFGTDASSRSRTITLKDGGKGAGTWTSKP